MILLVLLLCLTGCNKENSNYEMDKNENKKFENYFNGIKQLDIKGFKCISYVEGTEKEITALPETKLDSGPYCMKLTIFRANDK